MRTAWRKVQDSARAVPGVQSVALTDIVPMQESVKTTCPTGLVP